MRILHLTDTHLFAEAGTLHYDRIDTDVALRAVLDRLTGLDGIDLVVHSGDASEDGTVASYQRLHELLDPFAARLDAPFVVAMGNHDQPSNHGEVAGEGATGPTHQDRVVDIPSGGRVVVLDTSVPGAGYGHLEPEQVSWLREVLATPAGGGVSGQDSPGTVLVMHHPPLPGPTRLMRSLEFDGVQELADVLAGSDVRIVLSGHYHLPMSGTIAGIPVHVAPGITNIVDPLTASESERSLALSGASIVDLDEDPGSAPRVVSSVWPNVGDAAADITCPVYEFGPETVDRISEAAGR